MKNKLSKVWLLLSNTHKRKFIFLLILVLILSFLELLGVGLIIPFLMILIDASYQDYSIINKMIILFNLTDEKKLIVFFLIIILIVFLIKNILNIFIFHIKNKIFFDFYKDLQNKIMKNYLKMPYKKFIQLNSSKLVNTLNSEIETFVLGVLDPIVIILIETLSISAIFIILIYLEPKGSFFLIIMTMIIFLIFYKFVGSILKKIGEERLDVQNKVQKIVIQCLHGIKDIKIVNAENNFFFNFQNRIETLSKKLTSQKILMDSPRFIIEIFVVIFLVTLSLIILQQGKSFSELLIIVGVFAAAGFRIMPSLNRLVLSMQSLKYTHSVIDLIYNDLVNLKTNNIERSQLDKYNIEEEFKEIKFENVSFKYHDDSKYIFKDINLKLSKTDFVGIYGESGVGKSTFVDILSGLLEPTSGQLLVNDKHKITSSFLSTKDLIGYVPQNIYLNDESISSNIAFGEKKEKIDNNLVNYAINNSKLRNFVDELKLKENTLIGERGIKISGGQKQRLGIARALYRKSKILIFDESTSSLDEKTENEFLEIVKNLSQKVLIILISHKPNTLKYCNKIYRITNKSVILEKKTDENI
jgi:ATP-binding cassette, subfamily B, bacterial PglK